MVYIWLKNSIYLMKPQELYMLKPCQTFNRVSAGQQALSLLPKALSFVQNKNAALDLGLGNSSDSRYLMSQGFKRVTALHPKPFNEYPPSGLAENNFEFIHSPLALGDLPEKTFDLVNAQSSLPYHQPLIFNGLWKRIKKSLADQGVFTGQFFGVQDERNIPESNMVFHTIAQVEYLFEEMEILKFRLEENISILPNGKTGNWQIYHVIAKTK